MFGALLASGREFRRGNTDRGQKPAVRQLQSMLRLFAARRSSGSSRRTQGRHHLSLGSRRRGQFETTAAHPTRTKHASIFVCAYLGAAIETKGLLEGIEGLYVVGDSKPAVAECRPPLQALGIHDQKSLENLGGLFIVATLKEERAKATEGEKGRWIAPKSHLQSIDGSFDVVHHLGKFGDVKPRLLAQNTALCIRLWRMRAGKRLKLVQCVLLMGPSAMLVIVLFSLRDAADGLHDDVVAKVAIYAIWPCHGAVYL